MICSSVSDTRRGCPISKELYYGGRITRIIFPSFLFEKSVPNATVQDERLVKQVHHNERGILALTL